MAQPDETRSEPENPPEWTVPEVLGPFGAIPEGPIIGGIAMGRKRIRSVVPGPRPHSAPPVTKEFVKFSPETDYRGMSILVFSIGIVSGIIGALFIGEGPLGLGCLCCCWSLPISLVLEAIYLKQLIDWRRQHGKTTSSQTGNLVITIGLAVITALIALPTFILL